MVEISSINVVLIIGIKHPRIIDYGFIDLTADLIRDKQLKLCWNLSMMFFQRSICSTETVIDICLNYHAAIVVDSNVGINSEYISQ